MAELTALNDWCDALLAKLTPTERRKLARQIATELRRSNSERIGRNVSPEGEAFAPRKPSKLRQQKGAIRARMFTKLKTARQIKAGASTDAATVGFAGRTARIARVHQLGLRDQVKPGGPEVQYQARPLLGIAQQDADKVRDLIAAHLAQ